MRDFQNAMQHKRLYICETKINQMLQECFKKKNLSASNAFHSFLCSSGLDNVSFFSDHLIRLYAQCGSLQKCNQIFYKSQCPTLYTWNSIMAAYAELESDEKVFELFLNMKQQNLQPDKFTFLPILKVCSRLGSSLDGRWYHQKIIWEGIETDNLIGSTLIDMYAKCSCMEDARKIFDSLVSRDIVTWNAMIGGYAQYGLCAYALELAQEMIRKGITLNEVTFASLLKACSSKVVCEEIGYVVCDKVFRQGLDSVLLVGNSILDMYAKCGNLDAAKKLFKRFKHRDIVSWNTMIAGFVRNGYGWMGVQYFISMQQVSGLKPDKCTFCSVLQACGVTGDINNGMLIHHQIIEIGIDNQSVVHNMLLDMYAKCTNLSDVCQLFGLFGSSDVSHWNSIIAGYTQNGDGAAALILYERMLKQNTHPNDVTYSWILKACIDEDDFEEGKLIHDDIIKCGLESNSWVGSALVDMYAHFGFLEEGKSAFDGVSTKDLVLWNALSAAYVRTERHIPALQLFVKMSYAGIHPDKFTFSCIVSACSCMEDVEIGRMIHDLILKCKHESDLVVENSLVDMYGKLGCIEDSNSVFQNMASKDIMSWNAFLGGCVHHGTNIFVLKLFQQMQEENITPDELTYVCVLKACISGGAIIEGRLLHDQVIKGGYELNQNIKRCLVDMYTENVSLREGMKTFGGHSVPWDAMIVGQALHGNQLLAFEWFMKMLNENIKPEKSTYLALLKVCSDLGAVVQGKIVHDDMVRNSCDMDLISVSTLVDMYGKCGKIAEASLLFNRMPTRDLVSWNAMIAGYTQHGDYSQAETCLEQMKTYGLKPDERTYSSILAACSRSGRPEDAQRLFMSMRESYDITPDIRHFSCMTDIMSRAGCFNEAELLLKSSPGSPDVSGWRAMLSACKAHGDTVLGEECYTQAVLSSPESSSGYILMSNIYADAFRLDDAYEIQKQRVTSSAWKMPGKAWIEISQCIHEFTVGGKGLPQGEDITAKQKQLSRKLESEGYVPEINSVVRWVASK